MAEGLLANKLHRRGVDATVVSAGFLPGGLAVAPEGIEVLKDYGARPAATESRQVDDELLDRADLVVAMTREHVRETAIRRPDTFGRTFTLKELVRRGGEVGPRGPDEPLDAWLDRVAQGRGIEHHMGASPEDDIPDPVGQPVKVFQATARDLDALLERLVDLAWPEADG